MTAEADRNKNEVIRNNEAKLASLYEEYYDKIAHYIFVRTGNRSEAEDLAGEVFVKALESAGTYKERGIPMQAWLFRIAHNLVVDHLRKAAKRKTVPLDTVQIENDANPVTIAEKNLELERVTRMMDKLTREQREVLRLRFFGGLTSNEAGSVLRKSSGAVREMQRAAIEKLRNLLAEESQSLG